MEAYTLDPLLRRISIIDRYETLIWTERYVSHGDFKMVIHSSFENISLLKAGTLLAMNLSYRVMMVETVESVVDEEGKRMLTVEGRSLEAILLDRVAKESLSNLATSPKWIITDQPGDIARKIFHDICVTGILDVNDIIPFIIEGSIMPEDTIPEPAGTITVELEPTTVYEAIEDICKVWNLGFRILRNYDTSELYFDIYSGSDRTTGQTTLPPVLFTPELQNLRNTKELTTIDDAKNVAYVYSPAGFLKVYPVGVDPDVEGFERKVLVVKADDITDETPDIPTALAQRGLEELSKHRTFRAFDGEISQNSEYKYGTHYHLGDLIEMRSEGVETNNMRVTEQIFVSDREGERAYPTLALHEFVNAGSWLSWLSDKTWSEMGPTEYWGNQP